MSHGSDAAEAGAALPAASMATPSDVAAARTSNDVLTRRSADLTVIIEPAFLLGDAHFVSAHIPSCSGISTQGEKNAVIVSVNNQRVNTRSHRPCAHAMRRSTGPGIRRSGLTVPGLGDLHGNCPGASQPSGPRLTDHLGRGWASRNSSLISLGPN